MRDNRISHTTIFSHQIRERRFYHEGRIKTTRKEQLIKAGKIKRDKHKSIIFRRDNSHYEKLDGIERCIDDEIPFEIPDTWAWIRMGSLFAVNPRNVISDDTVVGFMPMLLITLLRSIPGITPCPLDLI